MSVANHRDTRDLNFALQLIYQYIPSVQFTPPIPVGHVQLNVLLPASLQLPPFKQGLGSHTEGTEKDKKK